MIVKDTTTFCILFLQCKNQTENGSVDDNKSLKPIKVLNELFNFLWNIICPVKLCRIHSPWTRKFVSTNWFLRSQSWGGGGGTLLEKLWRISLYVTDDAIAMLHVT